MHAAIRNTPERLIKLPAQQFPLRYQGYKHNPVHIYSEGSHTKFNGTQTQISVCMGLQPKIAMETVNNRHYYAPCKCSVNMGICLILVIFRNSSLKKQKLKFQTSTDV